MTEGEEIQQTSGKGPQGFHLKPAKAPLDMYMVSWRTPWMSPDKTLAMILYRLVTGLMGLEFEILLV